ncbi:MAG: NAD-dependent epimerase/dehydratase family protein [Candidatus Marinimicrobia bacterium]|nr:NAD-dependent epimerase/dehydratase family protein [Candidatus Neomarinimicrobiota bacterium]MCH8070041.1 NAD-dependent epimerase/dehydratase family protein [Candidatus Neomarinimicrobiota bacterium]
MSIERILVTGSAGFIGFHLSKSLLDDGYEVLGIDNLNDYYDPKLKWARLDILKKYSRFTFQKIDIADREALTQSFQSFDPQKVVNLAAQAGVRYSIENPYAYMNSNLVGFLNILELCRHNDVEGLIYASSSSVYGGNEKIPFSVEDRVDKPIALYGATKRANELMAYSYSHLYGLHTTGLRYFTVYGPWGRPDMAYYLFTEKISKGEPIQVFNHGNMRRDFTYIDDIIAGTRVAIDMNYRCEIFNLGNHKSEHLMDMIALIEKELRRKAKIDFQPIQPGDVRESYADIKHSHEKLGYTPITSIEIGIPKLIEWYKEYKK